MAGKSLKLGGADMRTEKMNRPGDPIHLPVKP